MLIDARIHGRPRVGEPCSGDAGKVHTTADVTWVLLVDALGHGPRAAEAAALAVAEFERITAGCTVEDALVRIHEQLRGSRGAAGLLLRFDERGMCIGGVGNVELRSLGRRNVSFVQQSGILGGRMRTPRATRVELEPGDRLLLFTDGIARRAPFERLAALEPESLCAALLEHHSHLHDDATVIHLTYNGPAGDRSNPE